MTDLERIVGALGRMTAILAAMPEVMAIAKTFEQLYPGKPPGGSGSDPDRRVKQDPNIVQLFGRRAA